MPDRGDGVRRITNVSTPTLEIFPAAKKNAPAVIVSAGGGYSYVIYNKEGLEIAKWLNANGITALVLKYRTPNNRAGALQDVQRAIRLARANAKQWNVDPKRLGVMGFSAGGQLAALTTTRFDTRAYEPSDAIDANSCRPDFSMLIYPWQLLDGKTMQLSEEFPITSKIPPTFIVHTHDDGSTSLGPVWFYARLKEAKIPAELHVYEAGGHGYGLRPVAGTTIHKWIDPAADWLKLRKIVPTVQTNPQ